MLKRVTITGADDSTSVPQLVDLSLEFPFVEWGILVSKKQEGGYRFPARHWIDRFSDVAARNKMNISTHVCGRWVREMFIGDLDWNELPSCIEVCQRVQVNTHAERHISTVGLIQSLQRLTIWATQSKEFIFQWDGVNDHLAYAAHGCNINTSALFDTSGGAGILPGSWPHNPAPFPCGYAGGLGPDNVVGQVKKIEAICPHDYWIDMERRVRTPDDSSLDMDAVRKVLKECAGFFG
jgi:hypothetical protein